MQSVESLAAATAAAMKLVLLSNENHCHGLTAYSTENGAGQCKKICARDRECSG
jgi:hypothetical protein